MKYVICHCQDSESMIPKFVVNGEQRAKNLVRTLGKDNYTYYEVMELQ